MAAAGSGVGVRASTRASNDVKALVGAINQEKALVGAFSVIVQPVVEPMDRFAALHPTHCGHPRQYCYKYTAANCFIITDIAVVLSSK